MKPSCVVLALAALAARVSAQSPGPAFEAADFNVTAALESIGVNVDVLPDPEPALVDDAAAALTKRSTALSCLLACSALKIVFGSKVLSEGSAVYNNFTGSYWSAQQAAVNPSCVFKPAQSTDVSALVLISRLYLCPFAAKGGGHAAFAGASNIEGGITLSLENINHVRVAANKQTVDVGPGNRWIDVYSAIEKYGVGVVGGRVAPVGVAGLTLGGGISHFSHRRGWACDNVAAYEVVTASGLIITATPTAYADLYWALRGGSGNFGIVTNFKLAAFPLGGMWGGSRMYLEGQIPAVFDAMYNFTTVRSLQDPDAAEIVTFANAGPGVGNVALANLHYAKPVANAPVFDDWNAIPHATSDTDLRTLVELVNLQSVGTVYGQYQSWWDITLRMDRELMDFAVNKTFFTLQSTLSDIVDPAALTIISIQPITPGILTNMQKNGGNALGLNVSKGPYFILNMSASFTIKANEQRYVTFFAEVIKRVKAEAKRRGLDNDYIYMNYASPYQDPIASYGATNKQRLINISRKYDPTQVLQLLSPGYFKLIEGALLPLLS